MIISSLDTGPAFSLLQEKRRTASIKPAKGNPEKTLLDRFIHYIFCKDIFSINIFTRKSNYLLLSGFLLAFFGLFFR